MVSTLSGVLRMAVDSAVSSGRSRLGAIGHLDWHARRSWRAFPEMEADTLAATLPSGRNEFVPEASHRARIQLLGVTSDLLVGRLVAHSTTAAFTGQLARAAWRHLPVQALARVGLTRLDQRGGVTMAYLDHDSLLALARKAHAAASDADPVRLTEDLDVLVHALVHHLLRERVALTRLPPPDARLVRRGQARIVAAARAILQEAQRGCAGPVGRCTARAEELLALLTLQVRDERLALHGAAGHAFNRG